MIYNVLILDDEKREREVIKYLLRKLPYNLNNSYFSLKHVPTA